MKSKIVTGLTLILLILVSCRKPSIDEEGSAYTAEPALPSTPYTYAQGVNDDRATLGRVLFYDKKLSLNNSVSCGSCHQQAKAFCDNLPVSTGLTDAKTARNSPSLFARQGRAFWDGRAATLEDLALRPIKNHVEMKFTDMEKLCEKLSGVSYYPALFEKAFGNGQIDSTRIQLALGAFLRSFNFSSNKFGSGQPLSVSEQAGKELFFGRAQCFQCHHIEGGGIFEDQGTGYGFTDMDFNIGLDMVYKDKGRGAVTGLPQDDGKFMVPVLLNVEFTAPYMHDGRFKTLEEVVEHYNTGVKAHPNLSVQMRDIERFVNMSQAELLAELDHNRNGEIDESEVATLPIRRPSLSAEEKKSLVDFLKTLSDPNIRTDKRFSDPFSSK
jgi:cytochrome c peroxidase